MRGLHTCVLGAALALAQAAAAQPFLESFDTYAAGSPLAGQGGWEIWCTGGADAMVSDSYANSPSNAMEIVAGSDMVQRFTGATSGRYTFGVWTYVPSESTGDSYVMLMNTYCEGAAQEMSWSMVVRLGANDGVVASWSGELLPLIRDRWVELRAEIDLDNDTFSEYYDGQLLMTGRPWSTNVGPGAINIAATDLFGETTSGIYLDDVSLRRVQSCPADFDGSGTLTLADFVAFRNAYTSGNMAADFDGNGTLTLSDFVAFRNAYTAGCP